MTTAVLLQTMHCNIACAHCSVHSGPSRSGRMDLDVALSFVESLAKIENIQYIDLSGGEPLLYADEVCEIVRHIKSCGKQSRLTTNGYWASSMKQAEFMLRRLKEAGLDAVGLSLDKWHLEFLPARTARFFVDACRLVGFPPLVSCVVRGRNDTPRDGHAPGDLRTLLDYYGLGQERATDLQAWGEHMEKLPAGERAKLMDETIRERLLVNWQFLTGEGRAATALSHEIETELTDLSDEEPCPIAGLMPTIDQDGRLFPCCAPWVNRHDRAYARTSSETLQGDIAAMQDRPALQVIRRYGPKRLLSVLRRRGVEFPEVNSGICNLCGQMLDRLTLDELDAAAMEILSCPPAGGN